MTDPREIAQRIRKLFLTSAKPASMIEDEVAAILAAEMPRWVPVEEKLPELEQRVLIVYRGTVWTARWSKLGNNIEWLLPTGCADRKDVPCWQELPALPSPPKEEAK